MGVDWVIMEIGDGSAANSVISGSAANSVILFAHLYHLQSHLVFFLLIVIVCLMVKEYQVVS